MATTPSADEIGRFVEQALSEGTADSLFRPLQKPSAVDEVSDRLLAAIAIGEFVPGERLPVERSLARMLGVGRSTVHEAMGRLGAAGIVEVRRGRAGGAFVRSDWSANSAGGVRGALGARWVQIKKLFAPRGLVGGMGARTAAGGRAVRRTRGQRGPQIERLSDLGGLVEGMVARTAAERRPRSDVVAMEQALPASPAARTPKEEHPADPAIPRAVTAATGNPQ